MTDLIGGGRLLRVCDLCGGVDDHPRHTISAAPGDYARPSVEVTTRVYELTADLPMEERARLISDLLDTGAQDRHMDCCRAVGCPTGDCNVMTAGVEELRGAELLGHLDNARAVIVEAEAAAEPDKPRKGGGSGPRMPRLLLLTMLMRLGLYTVGLSATNFIDACLNVLRNTTFTAVAAQWVQLHTNAGDPGAAGTSNVSSVTTRMQITWAAPSGTPRTISLTASVSWTNWAGTNGETVAYISLWSASTAGTFYASFQLTTPRVVNTNDTLTLTSASISLAPAAA